MKRTLTILLALCGTAQAGLQDAVCRIGNGCSAVCVDPSGIILTAKHCEPGETETIRFEGHPPIEGRRIYVDELAEGVVAFDIDGDDWAFAPVADTVPSPGSPVESWGYPKGKLTHASGKVTGGSESLTYAKGGIPQGQFAGNTVDFKTGPGWSGGPLFNDKGEVVGILSAGDNKSSIFIAWRATRKAYEYATRQFAPKESMLVFGFSPCAPCDRFKADVAAGRFSAYDVEYVDVLTDDGEERYLSLVAALEKATGKKQPEGFPAFHIAGRASLHVGYQRNTGLSRLLGWGRETLRLPLTIVDSVTGTPSGIALPPPGFGEKPKEPVSTPIVTVPAETQPTETPDEPAEDLPTDPVAILTAGGLALLELLASRRQAA